MLARHPTQFEQASLILFQRPWVEGEGTAPARVGLTVRMGRLAPPRDRGG